MRSVCKCDHQQRWRHAPASHARVTCGRVKSAFGSDAHVGSSVNEIGKTTGERAQPMIHLDDQLNPDIEAHSFGHGPLEGQTEPGSGRDVHPGLWLAHSRPKWNC